MGEHPTSADFDRVRLESDTLYDVIGVVASAPDLSRVLRGVVDVLTRATRSHACFVYLLAGDRLRLRAASPVFAHLVGEVEFGIDEGLTGWVARANRPAFIRDRALDDPRTNYLAELREEDFQSMVAVPVTSRRGDVIGVIVLHSQAPREFDDSTLKVIVHAAPLVAGAIENAQLYEEAQLQVETLTNLTTLSQQIAAVSDREELYRVAITGVRALLGASEVRLFEADDELGHRYSVVAQDPPDAAGATGTAVTIDQSALLHDDAQTAPLQVGAQVLGALTVRHDGDPPRGARDLLHAVANQVAVALAKAELIERLTEENLAREVFHSLETGALQNAEALAQRAHCVLAERYVMLYISPTAEATPSDVWLARAERIDLRLRRLAPGSLGDVTANALRILLPLGTTPEAPAQLDRSLVELGEAEGVVIGRSDAHSGASEGSTGLREASDAARVARSLSPAGGSMAYRNLGAYRYLVHSLDAELSQDPYLEAIHALAEYDLRRGAQLVTTLEQFMTSRRGITETARALVVHPNTLRQRLDRIAQITGLDLSTVDELALALALKLARLQRTNLPDGGPQ